MAPNISKPTPNPHRNQLRICWLPASQVPIVFFFFFFTFATSHWIKHHHPSQSLTGCFLSGTTCRRTTRTKKNEVPCCRRQEALPPMCYCRSESWDKTRVSSSTATHGSHTGHTLPSLFSDPFFVCLSLSLFLLVLRSIATNRVSSVAVKFKTCVVLQQYVVRDFKRKRNNPKRDLW